MHLIRYTTLAILLLASASIHALEEYTLIVQPIQSPKKTIESYQPLADYLSNVTGQTIKLVTARNFVSYWQTMRKGKYDLILDAAHFTSWRIKKLKYKPLVKITSVVSFTLVTHVDNPVLGPDELIGRRLAVMASPSMGFVRLAELFPNDLRQPVIINVNNSQDAVEKIRTKKADAAIVPSRMVGGFDFLGTVEQTDQVPHMALSASPKVPADISNTIRKALIDAKNTPEGRVLLEKLVLESFDPTSSKAYGKYDRLLKGVYGY